MFYLYPLPVPPFVTDYLNKKIVEGSVSILQALIDGAMAPVMGLLSDTIFNTQPIKDYINYTPILSMTQRTAILIIPIYILYREVAKQAGDVINDESIQTKVYKALTSVFFVYFLPYFAEILITLNNLAVKEILTAGNIMSAENFVRMVLGLFGLDANASVNSFLFILLILLIVIVSFIVLGIVAAMRIFEIAIAIVFCPIACISYINRGDGLNVWFREFLSLCFTQTVQAFALRGLISIIDFSRNFIVNIALLVGGVVVMIKTPKILRNFVYSTGTGNAVVQAAGSVSRLMLMKKFVFK